MQSEIWKEKVSLVISRAHGTCEACGTERATTAWHREGLAHAGDETIYELSAVCRNCYNSLVGLGK